MGVSLTKGQAVSLTKEAGSAGLKNVTVGLGWDPATEGKAIDLDASVVLLGADGKAAAETDFVFFNNLTNAEKTVVHTGDNLTGEGDGDDEQIKIDLAALPASVTRIDVQINSYSGQSFTEVKNLTARVVNDADGSELGTFEATQLGDVKANLIARLERQGDEWQFTAVGEPQSDFGALIKSYGVNVG